MTYTTIRDRQISGLTLGTVQLGMRYGIANQTGKPNHEQAHAILETAWNGGVTSFDTAHAYGDSEEILGEYFSAGCAEKEKPVITTKFALKTDTELTPDAVGRQVRGFAEQSMERLRIKKIPVFLLHKPDDLFRYGPAVSEALTALKREGIIGCAGVSVYTVAEVEEMLKYEIFEAAQIPMNLLDQRMIETGTLDKLAKPGMIVFVRSVFLQGLFFLAPDKMPEKLAAAVEPVRQINELASREGISIAQLAISYIRDLKGVTSLVMGAETTGQIKENLALLTGPALTEKTRQEISKTLSSAPIEQIMLGLRW